MQDKTFFTNKHTTTQKSITIITYYIMQKLQIMSKNNHSSEKFTWNVLNRKLSDSLKDSNGTPVFPTKRVRTKLNCIIDGFKSYIKPRVILFLFEGELISLISSIKLLSIMLGTKWNTRYYRTLRISLDPTTNFYH